MDPLFPGSNYFNVLADATEDYVAVVDPKTFLVLNVNRVSEGFHFEEVQGHSIFKFLYPEYHEAFKQLMQDVISKKKKGSIELETKRRTNETGKAWYKCYISPVFNDSNEVENLVIVSKDITDSKLSVIRIRNKEEHLYAIINNTSDMILSIDRNYCLTEYNSVYAAIVEYAYKKKELIGTSVLDYINPVKHDELKAIYKRAFSGETVMEIQEFPAAKGSYIYFETSYNPIRDYNQNIIGISIFSKDITKRVNSEMQLKNALREKEVLLSEIHHRIKNNLAMVSSMLQLKEMFIENSAAKEALSDSRRRIKSTALVHEMLYRNEAFDKISIHDYLKELFSNLNSEITLVTEGDNEYLNLNKAQPFGLMMHELMMNSIKHSFRDKNEARLIIKTRKEKEMFTINYCDCSGEFPEQVDFYNTSTTGLMLIHTFIEQLEGTIRIVNRNPPSYEIQIPVQ